MLDLPESPSLDNLPYGVNMVVGLGCEKLTYERVLPPICW